jgi:hypothetical protein
MHSCSTLPTSKNAAEAVTLKDHVGVDVDMRKDNHTNIS